ncbi:MAG: 2-oxo-acid dehydrogenase subunit, homodimeric type [Betaproteobacteria bacterium]|nr:2-oxo-acid dehydrogenase subunit, homodimeric type [Betaproteobacteria bacterium]
MADHSEIGALLGLSMPVDPDPLETREWLEGMASVIAREGPARAAYLLRRLTEAARGLDVDVPRALTTPYRNTISLERQAPFPGDQSLEERITAIVRWNALAMVVRANKASSELGGHIASYASAADLFEVGFNHFFRGHGATTPGGGAESGGDLVFFQPHSAPGVYARAFLEGRIAEAQVGNYRREVGGGGLSSYPHPWLMPDFWQFPTGSMGLGPIQAVYQARFMRYLEHRGIATTAGRKVWAFVGDGEMDEPESLAALSLAAREGLDNLIFVVNCNLQRLDGPVRGNGSIIQELEGLFAGAGWNVIKLLWGSNWDALFARDHEGALVRRLHETVDGEFQKYSATDGRFNREHFFNKYPELQAMVSHMSDADIDQLKRGGHDPVKIHAAYHAASNFRAGPTVILAKTMKGFGMGSAGQAKMTTHQQKKMDRDTLLSFRDRFALPLSDEDVLSLKFYKPGEDSAEMKYLRARRAALGGPLPARHTKAKNLPVPPAASFAKFALEAQAPRADANGEARAVSEMSSTTAFVRMLTQLAKDRGLGKHIVPIVADEARTFGMQTLFRGMGIYAPHGQRYEPEDKDELLYYKEARDGQILEEGITEAGALSSWIAAATSHANHGVPMLPFYIYYSMFGFQRVADLIWAAADQRSRGFLVGATSGRTTLAGEGLQHQDGSSHLVASTVPNCRAYDPCFAHELAVILEEGMQAMLERDEDVFYYLTVMNENYAHVDPRFDLGAALAQREGIVRGMYLLKPVAGSPQIRLLGSGAILREVLAAADLLEQDFGVSAAVYSVTSYSELQRDGMAAERASLHAMAGKGDGNNDKAARKSWVMHCLGDDYAPVVAASDYVRALPELIRAQIAAPYATLGTDGFGRSDTRAALRRFFEVDKHHVVLQALASLAQAGTVKRELVAQAAARYQLELPASGPWLR